MKITGADSTGQRENAQGRAAQPGQKYYFPPYYFAPATISTHFLHEMVRKLLLSQAFLQLKIYQIAYAADRWKSIPRLHVSWGE